MNTKESKLSALKDWLHYIILPVVAVVVYIIMIVSPIIFAPTATTQATVTAVGYNGVTVEYKGQYGQEVIKKIGVDDVSGYRIGDTVTIEIKAFFVNIVK